MFYRRSIESHTVGCPKMTVFRTYISHNLFKTSIDKSGINSFSCESIEIGILYEQCYLIDLFAKFDGILGLFKLYLNLQLPDVWCESLRRKVD